MMTNLGCSAKSHPSIKAKGYVIVAKQNSTSQSLAETLYNQIQELITDKNTVEIFTEEIPNDFKAIELELNPDLSFDYCIKHEEDKLLISFKNQQDTEWIISQFISALSMEDERFKQSVLPPPTIQFHTHCKNFDFSYRDPHYAMNLIPGNSNLLGNQNVDSDWGIWGHNLTKVMSHIEDSTIYALVNDVRNKNQFSFTSPELLNYLTTYIIDNFGEGKEKSYHFMIMPQDNNLVCTCPRCKEVGNTKTNATPAVSYFIQKISERFPKHQFFTSSYLTTQQIPEAPLNNNTGVFLSTILLKKGVELNENQPETATFIKELSSWKDITPNIYIWDYSANFDDYLTPIPVLNSIKKQLQFYKNQGINGVFLNASGYDYSSFGDLKAFVISSLLKNVNVNINELCISYFKSYYPISQNLLSEYYLTLEDDFIAKNKPYNLYAGFDEITSSYLNVKKFNKFYTALGEIIPLTKGEEKEKLKKLHCALTYTKLQIRYNQVTDELGIADLKDGNLMLKPDIELELNQLRNHSIYSDLTKYKEAKGNLSDYIHFWEELILQNKFSNLILNRTVKVLTQPNEGFENSKLLTNGLPGFENDYHQGWYISSQDLKLEINTDHLSDQKRLNLRFLNNSRHGFYPPEKIEVWSGNKLLDSLNINEYDNDLKALEIELYLNLTDVELIEIKLVRRLVNKSLIACDEIRILN